ncbi:MAG: SCO family protein [Rhodospirillaceae bacterium]|nr:SCO family protein [Rhodospirillaceae bacterium]
MSKLSRLFCTILLLAFVAGGADAATQNLNEDSTKGLTKGQADPVFDGDAAMEKSRQAAGNNVAGLRFVDAQGKRVNLIDYQGKPLIINMVYSSCAHFCGVLARNLIEAVESANGILGKNAFTVISVGFDTKVDTPNRMRQWGDSQGIDFDNWHMLAGDALNVRKLGDAIGFTWAPSPIGFDHTAQTTLVDAAGRVAYQVYGSNYDPPILVEPLKRIALGERLSMTSLDGLVNRVRLFCTIYDPKSGRYEFDYSILISILIGTLILGSVGTIVARAWWREYRAQHPA